MNSFYVIFYNINNKNFERYDVMPYFKKCWDDLKISEQPKTEDELREWLRKKSMHKFWARTQWEVVLVDLPCKQTESKVDVHSQIMMNFELFIELFKGNVNNFNT